MAKKNNEFLILGSIILGLFVLLGVTNIDFSVEEAEAQLPEAEAQLQFPITVRNATSETTQVAEERFIAKFGMAPHIPNNEGEYVANLVYEDSNGIELESGTVSYYFDKNTCAMTIFNFGRINQTDVPIIKGDMWVVKSALNGTDIWTDVSQNFLLCNVDTTIQSNMIEINSTKSDVNGTITEIYHYDLYKGLKHDMYFTNNDPSLTNHKFSFSNILQEVPNSYLINIADENHVKNYFPQNANVNYTGTEENPTIYRHIDLTNNATSGDVLRTTTAIPVNPNDLILNATLLFLTNNTGHEAGNGTVVLYDQDLNLIGTSEEVSILDNTIVCDLECTTDVKTRFNFSPPIQINQTNATSVYVGIFFDDSGGKIVPITEGTGSVIKDISNTYPTAPDPFSDDFTTNSTNTFWTQLAINGVQESAVAQMYSQYQPIDQNYLLGGDAKVLKTASSGETIQYNATDFKLSDGTVINTGFTMLQKTTQPDPTKGTVRYEFVDGLEKLWAVKFVSNPDFTLDVYIDYANVTETTPVGGTINLDPILNINQMADRITSHAFGSTCGTGGAVSSEATTTGVASETKSGASASCASTYVFFDISSIPDDAVPIRITFQVNQTSGVCSGTFCTSIVPTRIWEVFAEDISGLSLIDFASCINQAGCVIPVDPVSITSLGNTPISPTFPIIRVATITSPSAKAILDFEAQLESGKDYVQYAICPSVFGGGSGCGGNGAVASRANSVIWERFGDSFFEVEYEFFDVPTEPLSVSAAFSPSPDTCTPDWEPPLDDGGRPIDGYQIERSTTSATQGFSVLVADTGTPIPTEFDDTTVTGGVSHFYRIAAINAEGVGAVSAASNGCGIPEISSAPINAVAQNVALNTVAVNWEVPFFDGNSAITGYKIERAKGGDPLPTNNDWFMTNWDREGSLVCTDLATGEIDVEATYIEADANTASNNGCVWNMFKTFDKDDIEGRTLTVDHEMIGSISSVFSSIRIFDGSYDLTDLGVDNGSPDTKGAGVIQTCHPLTTTAFSRTDNVCVIDTSSAITDFVTIFIQLDDANGTFLHSAKQYRIYDIEISAVRLWDITNTGSPTTDTDIFISTDNGGSFGSAGETLDVSEEGKAVIDLITADAFVVLVADTGSPLLEFIDDTVELLTEYGYRISAINGEGTSDPSNTAVVTTVGLPPPPENLEVTPTGTSTMDLDWDAPDVGASTIEGYQIDRKIGVGGTFSTINPFTGNDDTDFTDNFLAAGTEYCYQLFTFTNIGKSSTPSTEDCATTFDQADPPANLSAVAIDGSSINVTWDTPPDDGGSTITGYKIERQKESDAFIVLFAERQPESNRVLLDSGLEVGTEYTYRISAITGFGQGETGTDSATTDATPQAPPNLTCSPAGSTAINLSWDTPLTFSPPTGYRIDRALQGGSFSVLVADTGNTATTFQDTTITVDQIFTYKVLGLTAEGDTDFSEEVDCSGLSAPDFPPANLQGDFSEVVPHQTVLRWDIPESFGIPITSFRVERDDGAGYSEIASVTGTSIVYIDQELDNDIDQKYRVITVGSEGETVPSIAVPFDANQTSHWHYENTIDDTGENKNMGTVVGAINFTNSTTHIGEGFLFDGTTRIEVDSSEESDYDFDSDFGITTYYKSSGGNVTSLFNSTWQLSEQGMACCAGDTIDSSFTLTPPLDADLTVAPDRGFAHVFKVFNKTDIINKNFTANWAGTFSGAAIDERIMVFDGSHDRTNRADFPLNDGRGFCLGVGCEKGSGLLHEVTKSTAHTSTDTINMTLAGSTDSEITIAFTNRMGSSGTTTTMDVINATITDVGTWVWDSSASVTNEVTGTTRDDYGFTDANFTSIAVTGAQAIVTKADTLESKGYKLYTDDSGFPNVRITDTSGSNEIHVRVNTDVNDDTLHFIGFGYNGNSSASGIEINIDGSASTPFVITDNLSGSFLNDEPLSIGGTASDANRLVNATILDETRIFGSGSLGKSQLFEVAGDKLDTVAPLNATMSLDGSTFANISGELPNIILFSGFPSPSIGVIDLKNFTTTTVNTVSPSIVLDPITGVFVFDRFFNVMGSLSNYTAETTLTNVNGSLPLLSNFDIQSPLFTFSGDFFFQQARNPTFDILSFNFTQTSLPFDLQCNFKSELFGNGTTRTFTDRFFVQHLEPVNPFTDVVVACIDPNVPPIDPDAPSFGGANALFSFVSFGDSTGIGNFLQFTENYGDFFGAGLPFLFIIILAAAFTGRSAPTGIIIIGVALGIMWFLGIIEQDPIMWGIIIALIVLGALAGKKFL